jgi:MscS family membrane protein
MNQWLSDTLLWIPTWKWMALGIILCAGLLIASLLVQILGRLKKSESIRKHLHGFIRHSLDTPIHKPLSWIVVCFLWLPSLDALDLTPGLDKNLTILVRLLLALASIRLAYCVADALGKRFRDVVNRSDSGLDDHLAPFATKTLKVIVVVLGALITMQNFGINVMSLLAGLGLGGLALALAAQDTAANLFGSITIIFDKPFQVGDWIKISDTEGIVEEVGFRSTRIRTFYKSLVTIPNSTMAKEKIDNMGVRPARRIRHTLGIVYETPIETLHLFIAKVRSVLSQHPQVKPDEISVSLTGLGDSAVQILVNCFVFVTLEKSESDIQEELLFAIIQTAQSLGVDFAYPTALHYTKNLDQPALAKAATEAAPRA